jgi:predicted Zn-dependent peptidase
MIVHTTTTIKEYGMNRRCLRIGPAALLLLLFVFSADVAVYAGGPEESPIDLDVTVEVLDNGLKVILLEDHSVPVISYQTFFRVGSRNERPGITGISHFLEHMMFNGAERYGPKEFDRILEANGGYSNAFTSNDMTAYYEDIASDGLELVIDLDTDRMASLALDPKYLESEMGVVMEERRVSIDNSVSGRMREELTALAYKAHPYAWPVLGWMSDLEKIDRDDCVEYFRTYYAPNNAVLIVAGDFETDKALKLIHKYYDGIPSQEPPAPVRTREPEQLGERRANVHKKAELPEIMIGYKVPDARSEDLYALEVIQQVLVEGESSRIHRKLVRDLGIAVYAYGYYPWRVDRSLFVFGAKIRPGHTTEEAERAVYEVLDEISREGVTDKELTKAKNALEANFVRSMQTVNGKATKIGRYEIIFGDYNEVIEVPRRYRSVTSDDVKRVVGKYFTEKQRNVVTLVPEA